MDQQPQQPPKTDSRPQPIAHQSAGIKLKKWSWKRRTIWILIGAAIVIAALLLTAWISYLRQLAPVSTATNNYVTITIEMGATPAEIGTMLEEKEVIRSAFAFSVYTRFHGYRDFLRAGTYKLSPSSSTQDIVTQIVKGSTDTIVITLYPGATLTDTTDTADNKKTDVTTVLKRAGYGEQEIAAALKKRYDSQLFSTKPASADLEGYVYGETYHFGSGASVEDILEASFDEMLNVIKDNNLVEAFQKKGLTLFEGITLASIVQREASSEADRRQVAQVFLLRLSEGMMLGSDVTFIYAANKMGVTPISTLDSPYNTRINTGLPPGPISSPGLSSLLAVANPAAGDYVYFVAGDDGKTYFAHTIQEHEQNVANYCTTECQKP